MEQIKTYGKVKVRPNAKLPGAMVLQWDYQGCFDKTNEHAIPWNQTVILRWIAKRYQKQQFWDREQLWVAEQFDNQYRKLEKQCEFLDKSILIGVAYLAEKNQWLFLTCDGVVLTDQTLLRYPGLRIGNNGIYYKDPHSLNSTLKEQIVWEKHRRLYGLLRELYIAFRSGEVDQVHPLCNSDKEVRYAYLQLLCLVQREADIITGWGLNRMLSLSDALHITRGFVSTQLTASSSQHNEQKLSELLMYVSPNHYSALFWDALTVLSYGQIIRKPEQLPQILRTLARAMFAERADLLLQDVMRLLPRLPEMYQFWEISDFCQNEQEEKCLYKALYSYYASAAAELKGEYIHV